jgi:hypothetical protein
MLPLVPITTKPYITPAILCDRNGYLLVVLLFLFNLPVDTFTVAYLII